MDFENRSYGFSYLMVHLARSGQWSRLYQLIEEKSFLAPRAAFQKSFREISQDIERHALARVIRDQDWPRFIHFALLAANLRGMAESLADEDILQALARQNQSELGLAVTEQLNDPLIRVRSHATLVANTSDPAFSENQVKRIIEELDSLSQSRIEREVEKYGETLVDAAEKVGGLFLPHWVRWLQKLSSDLPLKDRVHLALARNHYRQKGLDHHYWRELKLVKEPCIIVDHLTTVLATSILPHFEDYANHLKQIFKDRHDLLWRLLLAALGNPSFSSGSDINTTFRTLYKKHPFSWSMALIEAGAAFWPKLSSSQHETCSQSIQEPDLRVALLVLAREEDNPQIILNALDQISDARTKLHWTLRYLEQAGGIENYADIMWGISSYLTRIDFEIENHDLVKFFNIMASIFPERARGQLQNLARSPAVRSETLLTLASGLREPGLLKFFFDQTEHFAVMVAPSIYEGFVLRSELLIRLVCRLYTHGDAKDLSLLVATEQRLLPLEREKCRIRLALALAERGANTTALEVCDRIRSRRDCLVTRFRVSKQGQTLENPWDVGMLYETVADVGKVESEYLALAALLEAPLDAEKSIERFLQPIPDRERAGIALIALAHHHIAYQECCFEPSMRDPLGAVRFFQPTDAAEGSDRHMLQVIPELALLGARVKPAYIDDEFAEGISRLFALKSIPFSDKLETLEILVSTFRNLLTRPHEQNAATQKFADLMSKVLFLPDVMLPSDEREILRRHWHEVSPILVAHLVSLPLRNGSAVLKRAKKRIAKPAWFSDEQKKLINFYFSGLAAHLETARSLLEGGDSDPEKCRALVYLLSRTNPQTALNL